MKKTILLFFLMGLSMVTLAQKKDARLEGLEQRINQLLKEWNVPGVSIAVVEKNKVLFTGGFGYKDYENKKPVTSNTLFAIGSCTKAFTAALLGDEMKEGRIDIDAPVHSYFPELQFFNNELTANVTVRDMLCHRTGVPRNDFSWYSGAAVSRDSLVYSIRFMEPSAPIRQSFQYNNLMYAAVARLLEKKLGKSWEELIQEKFFKPLGMRNSTTGEIPTEADIAFGYIYKNNELKKLSFLTNDLKGIAPVGGINSTANDMANWLLMWTNRGKLNNEQVIDLNYYNQAISSQMVANANLPSKLLPDYYFFNYGLGWYTANYRGHYGVGHGGNINGFSSFISFLPTDSIGVYVAVNQNNAQLPRILSNLILDRMIGAAYRDWNAIIKSTPGVTNKSEETKKEAETTTSHPLTSFEGNYISKGYGSIVTKVENGRLTGRFNRWKLNIKHVHHNYFKFIPDTETFDESQPLIGEFSVTETGGIGSLKIAFEDNVKEIEFKKQAVAQLSKSVLQKYVGDYEFSGVIAKIILTEAGILKAIVPGQPEYELDFIQQDEFAVKGAKGVSIKFERDDKAEIIAGTFVQPNGSFKTKRVLAVSAPATKKGVNLQKYVGEYNLGGQTIKVFIKEEVLTAKIPGQPDYTLISVGKDAFSIKGVSGYSVQFETNEQEEVISFILTQPSGNAKAMKMGK